MHEQIVNHRKVYGDNWLTVFPDGLEIPWRQLSLQEFLQYDDLFRSGRYTTVEIEDEIFSLAVLQGLLVENIDLLPAGIVTTVVSQILTVSGPQSPEQMSEDLNIARSSVQDFFSSAVTLICSVFPAYKPEDIFQLSYETVMKRLAMAEKRLLELGVIAEPISVLNQNNTTDVQQMIRPEPPSVRRKKELLEARQKEMEAKLTKLNPDTPTSSSNSTVITKQQMSTRFDTDTGHELQDKVLWQHDALQGLEFIYPEYFKLMKEGKKITPQVIQETKGTTAEAVKEKHEEYIQEILDGKLKPTPPKLLVADKLEGQAVNKNKPAKVRVKRR